MTNIMDDDFILLHLVNYEVITNWDSPKGSLSGRLADEGRVGNPVRGLLNAQNQISRGPSVFRGDVGEDLL